MRFSIDFDFKFGNGRADSVLVLNNNLACLGELCIGSLPVQLPLFAVSGVMGDGESLSGVESLSLAPSDNSSDFSSIFSSVILYCLLVKAYCNALNRDVSESVSLKIMTIKSP